MAKRLYDPEESEQMADKNVLPMARALYLFLRTSFPMHDSGIGNVSIRKMRDLTGFGYTTEPQSDSVNLKQVDVIADILIPDLIRHGLIQYDADIIYIPNVAVAESFFTPQKLHSGNSKFKASFIAIIKKYESIPSNTGGINVAFTQFITDNQSSIDQLIAELPVFLTELNELQANNGNPKRIAELKKLFAELKSCKTLAPAAEILFANPTILPTEISEPFQSPFEAPLEKSQSPFEAPLEIQQTPLENPLNTITQLPKDSSKHLMGMGMGKGNKKDVSFCLEEGCGEFLEPDRAPPPIFDDDSPDPAATLRPEKMLKYA